jgi:tetratricopeptide (TPR) repeat protein
MSDHIPPGASGGGAQGPSAGDNETFLDQAKTDYKAGREFFSKGDYAQAAMAFHNALQGFEEQEYAQGVANAADRLGDVCMAKEEYRMALDHFRRAHAICQQESDIFSQASLDRKMADACRKAGELEEALKILLRLFDHYADTRNPKGTVEVLESISDVYLELGEPTKAADSLRTIAGIHRNFKHRRQAENFEQRAEQLERR